MQLIFMYIRYWLSEMYWYNIKCKGGCIKYTNGFALPYPYSSILVIQYLVYWFFRYLVESIIIRIKKAVSIIPLQSAFCTHPQIAFLILVHTVYKVGSEPILGSQVIKNVLLRKCILVY